MNIQILAPMPAPAAVINAAAIGERIRRVRQARGYANQAQIVDATKILQGTYSKIEAGAHLPKPDKLAAIADFLDVSIDYLVTGSDRYISAELWRLLHEDKGED